MLRSRNNRAKVAAARRTSARRVPRHPVADPSRATESNATPPQPTGPQPHVTPQPPHQALISIMEHPASDTHPSPPLIHQTVTYDHQAPTRNLIAKFTGQDENVHIDMWLNVFDLVLNGTPAHEKSRLIVRYLDGLSLTWFARHIIPSIQHLSWDQIKQQLITRFKETTIRPIIAANERHMTRNDTVYTYYNDQMRLLLDCGISDMDIIAILTKGMPNNYKPYLVSAHMLSPQQWLSKALELESIFKKTRAPYPMPHASFQRPQTQPQTASAAVGKPPDKKAKLPHKPCRFCKEAGTTEFHWHNECPRTKQASHTPHGGTALLPETHVASPLSKNE